MLNRNDCLHLINNHPKSQKTFKLSVTSLSAGKMYAVRDKRETFPDRTNNICYLSATINAEIMGIIQEKSNFFFNFSDSLF